MSIFLHSLHVLAAIVWVGGTFFIGFVAAPVLRNRLNDRERLNLMVAFGRRFRPLSWSAVAILWITGFMKVYFMTGFKHLDTFIAQPYGRLLAHKLALVILVTILSFIHDFILGNRYQAVIDHDALDTPDYDRLKRWTILLAVATEILLLAVIVLAVALRSQGLPLT